MSLSRAIAGCNAIRGCGSFLFSQVHRSGCTNKSPERSSWQKLAVKAAARQGPGRVFTWVDW